MSSSASVALTYHYEDTVSSVATGRLSKITGTGLPSAGVTYTYVPNSNLVNKHEFKTGSSTVVLDALWTHEPNRDLLTQVKNTLYTTTPQVSQYDYVNDSVARRTSMAMSGNMFSASHFFAWGYNDRNELTTADQFLGTPSSPGNRLAQYGDYDYAYDNIGNRDSYRLDADPATTYTPNEFNQYTSAANPAESFEYDEDGNLTEDGSRSYAWDAENRLVEVVPLAPANGDKKVRFGYDYMGRRVRKEVFTYAGGWPANPGEVQHFVYDNWNVVLVMNGLSSNQTVRKYTWGLDLSGLGGTPAPAGIHGAGGIGGLLACEALLYEETPFRYWYTYDANGNVVQVIDGTGAPVTMAAVAWYEYDPYGSTIAGSDAYLHNPFRFSTKWFDAETGLYYYGYRYYSPRLGRWLTRDPVEEESGPNLLAFTSNQPLSRVDLLGLKDCSTCWTTCLASQHMAKGGFVICRSDGCKCACVNLTSFPGGSVAEEALKKCVLAHEEVHVESKRTKCSCSGTNHVARLNTKVQGLEECTASWVEIGCLETELPKCGLDVNCQKRIKDRISQMNNYCRGFFAR